MEVSNIRPHILNNNRICNIFRCLCDVKTAVWVFIATGISTRKDLEMLVENTGSVCTTVLVYNLLLQLAYTFCTISADCTNILQIISKLGEGIDLM